MKQEGDSSGSVAEAYKDWNGSESARLCTK
jgi:hypothetical protein